MANPNVDNYLLGNHPEIGFCVDDSEVDDFDEDFLEKNPEICPRKDDPKDEREVDDDEDLLESSPAIRLRGVNPIDESEAGDIDEDPFDNNPEIHFRDDDPIEDAEGDSIDEDLENDPRDGQHEDDLGDPGVNGLEAGRVSLLRRLIFFVGSNPLTAFRFSHDVYLTLRSSTITQSFRVLSANDDLKIS